MRSMNQELMGLGLNGSKVNTSLPELKLELVPNDVKLEGSKNYLSWSRRVRVILGGKGVEHYLEASYVEPTDDRLMISLALSGQFGMQQTQL